MSVKIEIELVNLNGSLKFGLSLKHATVVITKTTAFHLDIHMGHHRHRTVLRQVNMGRQAVNMVLHRVAMEVHLLHMVFEIFLNFLSKFFIEY